MGIVFDMVQSYINHTINFDKLLFKQVLFCSLDSLDTQAYHFTDKFISGLTEAFAFGAVELIHTVEAFVVPVQVFSFCDFFWYVHTYFN